MKRSLLCTLALIVGFALNGLFAQEIQSPWISTDRTVDTSTYETIVKDVIKPGMKEEDKAIALFNFFRQMVYHYQNIPESRIPLKTINVIGNTLCGSQGTCMVGLLDAAGIKGRVVSHPGHTFYEAFYDGKWHGFDTMSNFYCFTRGENRNVASFEELEKDPTLISTAVAEKRNAPGWGACGDNPNDFKAKISINNYQPEKGGEWTVKNYSLRPGEEIVRSWWPQDYPLPGTTGTKDKFPHHTCGGKDDANPPELFKFWEPYLIRNIGRVSRSYRHYFNGWMNFSPDLTLPEFQEKLAAKSLEIPVRTSFYISGGKLYFNATTGVAEDSVEIFVSTVKGKEKSIFKSNEIGEKQYKVDLGAVIVRPTTGLHEYTLRFAINGNAKLNKFYLRTIFTHNAMAAPHLMPGKNNVTLTVGNANDLKKAPITVVYKYKEAPNWSTEKTIEKTIDTAPFTFEAVLPESEKLPQMTDLTLRNGKLSWFPELGTVPDKVLCDFSKAESVAAWGADDPLTVTHDGTGMLISTDKKSTLSQASMKGLTEDISKYTNIIIEMENLGDKQNVIFRVRSNEKNEERTDINSTVAKGKFVLNVPINTLTKVKLDKVDKIYLMMENSPETGCKVRINKITLTTDKSL
jgi:hypothetical protein